MVFIKYGLFVSRIDLKTENSVLNPDNALFVTKIAEHSKFTA